MKSVLALVAALVATLSLSGCIVIPAHRHYGPPTVVIERHHGHHGHPRHRDGYREGDDQGPYRR